MFFGADSQLICSKPQCVRRFLSAMDRIISTLIPYMTSTMSHNRLREVALCVCTVWWAYVGVCTLWKSEVNFRCLPKSPHVIKKEPLTKLCVGWHWALEIFLSLPALCWGIHVQWGFPWVLRSKLKYSSCLHSRNFINWGISLAFLVFNFWCPALCLL